MVTINEHKDYNEKANSITIIEGEIIHPLNSKRILRGKFFNILPKVWVFLDNPQYRDQYLGEEAFPLKKDYCKTPEQRTLYLKQIVQLFKRINTVLTGKSLLNYLSKVIPLNPLIEQELTVVNKFAQIIDYKSKKTHWVNTLIMPPGTAIDLYTACYRKEKIDSDKVMPLSVYPSVVSFLPDALIVMVDNNKIIYQDPSIALTHELIHSLHHTIGFI